MSLLNDRFTPSEKLQDLFKTQVITRRRYWNVFDQCLDSALNSACFLVHIFVMVVMILIERLT